MFEIGEQPAHNQSRTRFGQWLFAADFAYHTLLMPTVMRTRREAAADEEARSSDVDQSARQCARLKPSTALTSQTSAMLAINPFVYTGL